MTLPLVSKKSVAAAAAAFAVSCTLSACSSDDTATTGGGLSTAATALEVATEKPGEVEEQHEGEPETSGEPTPKKSTDDKKDEGKNGDRAEQGDEQREERGGDSGQGGGNAAAPIPTLINPLEEGLEVPTFEPIAGGREGTEAERREMEAVVKKITNPESFAALTRVILDNSCAEVREPTLEQFERQGLTLDMVEQMLAAQEAQGNSIEIPKSEIRVTDVRVEGDRASATVYSKTSAGENEAVQLFAKEDGKWKVCSS